MTQIAKAVAGGLLATLGTALSIFEASKFMADAQKNGPQAALANYLGFPKGTSLQFNGDLEKGVALAKIQFGITTPDNVKIPLKSKGRNYELRVGEPVGHRSQKMVEKNEPAEMKNITATYKLPNNLYGYTVEGSDKVNTIRGNAEVSVSE